MTQPKMTDIPDEIKKMTSEEIRHAFIQFYADKQHTFWKSSAVVPHNDPTLLFINAGMNQFKTVFTGEADPSTEMGKLLRATNSQKCIRAGGKHNDLDDVGKDVYHHTFFEMLGSWSFMDYFKKEAIGMAWELLTEVFKIPADRLYLSYYGGDAKQPDVAVDYETKQYWMDLGIPEDRILPFDMKDNFWEMGDTGPCGPCTEIHYDRIGGRFVPELVNMDDPDVLEIWNLVFMQYYRDSTGELSQLPRGSVDTGLGLERLVSVIQGHSSNYDTDLFTGIFKTIQEKTGFERPYSGKVGEDDPEYVDMAYRVLADHIRTLAIAIADGCNPSNEGRGYILRRVLRRAIRFGRCFLNAPKTPWFYDCLEPVAVSLSKTFPEIRTHYAKIQEFIKDEEVSFGRTLDKGVALFNKQAELVKASDIPTVFPSNVAFDLYTRCGFPFDLVEIMAEEAGMTVDKEAYEGHMFQHKKASENVNFKKAGAFIVKPNHQDHISKGLGVAGTLESSKYDWSPSKGDGVVVDATVMAILDAVNDKFIDTIEPACAEKATRVGIVLNQTNFYAEGGGQVGDVGRFAKEGCVDFEFIVEDTKRMGDYIFHIGYAPEGSTTVKVGDAIQTMVSYDIRSNTAKNHTATHILNFALRRALKQNCDQKGSVVDSQRLRFDFEFNRGLNAEEVSAIETEIAEIIKAEQNVFVAEVPLTDAMKINGLRAVAGDAYPDPVRMVSVGVSAEDCIISPASDNAEKHSVEFCGGTHLHNSREMEKLVVVSEEALAKGIRRITCYTGQAAFDAEVAGNEFMTKIKIAEAHIELKDLELALAALRNELKDKKDGLGFVVRREGQTKIDAIGARVLALQKEKSKLLLKKGEDEGDLVCKMVTEEGVKFVVVEDVDYTGGETKMEADPKAMDATVKKVFGKKGDAPTAVPLMVISSTGLNTVALQVQVPKALSDKINAANWGEQITKALGGKCGGKAEMARGMVKGCELKVDMDLGDIARKYAASLL